VRVARAAAWDAAHENSLAGLTLRDIATRVGMRQPSLYSHFASKNAIYDGMFEQAWRTFTSPGPPGPRCI
jgi:AcrR family transcriptional regulator